MKYLVNTLAQQEILFKKYDNMKNAKVDISK